MKKPMVWTTVFLVLMLVAFIPIVTAEQKISNAGDTTNPRSYLIELPELDMTGMYTDIEMIEIDPEITNSTTDWILLAHDDSGKKYLIEDIDSSDLSAAEKINTKNAVRKLWETYPTKFEDTGEKSIDIIAQSDGSVRTVSVPIGQVTRISFDKEKIKQTAKDNKDTRLMNAVQIGPSQIVLTETENMTVKNITNLREKKAKESSAKDNSPSSSGTSLASSNTGNSFTAGFSSTSSFTSESGFSSVPTNIRENSGTGLMAWSGSHLSGDPIPSNADFYTGHNSYAYWGSKYMGLSQYQDVAAFAGLEPDTWTPLVDPSPGQIITLLMHSIGHYYNPNPSEPIHQIVEGQAPDEFSKYAGYSKNWFNNCAYNLCTETEKEQVFQYFGNADHFLTDVGNPLHTGREIDQAVDKTLGPFDTHAKYEVDYVDANWQTGNNFGNIVKTNNVYYPMTNPTQSIKNLATFSHAYVDTLYYRVRNNPSGFNSDDTIRMITENCIRASARYTFGFAYYVKGNGLVSGPPAADIKYTIIDQDSNSATITFTDTSTGTVASRQWNFPDGLPSSTASTVTKTFTTAGMKRVTLTVSNQYNSDSKTVDVPVGRAPPVASFYIVKQQYPTILFISTSTGINPESNPTIWYWSFGDLSNSGDTSSPTVTHSYPSYSPIPYNVTLVAKNIYGNGIVYHEVYVPSPAVVSFIYNITLKTVTFIDKSTSASTWNWTFGDGNISTEKNPTHTYPKSGTYSVQLRIQDNNWTDQKILTQQINISDSSPLANFTANQTMGQAPFAVAFTDISTGNPTKWNWSFGDNSTSSEQNPVHVYTTDGSFAVSLNTTNTGGSNISIKTGFICTNCMRPIPPVADLAVNVTSGRLPLTVAFFGKNLGGPTNSWVWNFGDGQTSTLQNPVHIYNSKGNYSISLTITNTAGTSTRVLPNWIRPGFDIMTVNNTQNNSTISIARNTIIRLGLDQCTSCGYEWSLNITPGLNVINTSFLMNPALPSVNDGSGQNVWDMTAVGIGEQTIAAIYKQPWEHVTGNEMTFRLNITVSLPIIPLPGYSVMPTDPDSDGLYEDLNGNGRLDFADGVLFFNQMTWISANEPIAAFDLNGNGRIDFADIVVLFNEI